MSSESFEIYCQKPTGFVPRIWHIFFFQNYAGFSQIPTANWKKIYNTFCLHTLIRFVSKIRQEFLKTNHDLCPKSRQFYLHFYKSDWICQNSARLSQKSNKICFQRPTNNVSSFIGFVSKIWHGISPESKKICLHWLLLIIRQDLTSSSDRICFWDPTRFVSG